MSSAPASPPPAAEPRPSDFPFLDAFRNPAARTYALVAAGGLLASAALLYLFYFSAFGAGAVLVVGALLLDAAAEPPWWVHLLWLPIGLLLTGGGLRLAKAWLLGAEYRHRAREGRIAP